MLLLKQLLLFLAFWTEQAQHLVFHCSSDSRNYTSSCQYHSKPSAGQTFSCNTHLQHQLEQRNSPRTPGRLQRVAFISSPPNSTACSISNAEIPLLHSGCVPLSALSAVHGVAGCDGRSKDCHMWTCFTCRREQPFTSTR